MWNFGFVQVRLLSDARDGDGTVAREEYWANGTNLAMVLAPPPNQPGIPGGAVTLFPFTFAPQVPGTYRLTAVAVDDLGATNRAGQLTEAVATGRRLLELDDSQTAVRVTLACAQVRLGRLEDALKEYREAQSNGVSNTERRWGIRELERCLAQLPSASSERSQLQKLLQTLRGPDALEGGEEGED